MKTIYLSLKNGLIILMVLSAFALNAQTHITDRAGLEAMANNDSISYILDNDIDLAGAEWVCFDFRGTLDGNGFSILNLTANAPGETRVGFFKLLNAGGVVKNLGFVNANITCASQAGIIAGAAAGASISKCFVESGSVTTSGELVGGFSGLTYGITVSESYCKADVTGSAHVGGIIGHMNGGLIEDCRVDAVIFGTNLAAGGIVGWPHEADGAIRRCYAKGKVGTTNAFSGGIAGVDDNPFQIEITDCIAAQDSIIVNDSVALVPAGQRIITNAGDPNTVVMNNYGIETIPGTWADDANGLDGANMTAAQFSDATFFADNLPNWDFGMFGDGVWQMTNNGPLLAWETDPAAAIHNSKKTLNAQVYSSTGKIYVKTQELSNAIIKFYSITGSLLHEATLTSSFETFEIINSGVLIVEIVSPKARETFKIVNKL